MEAKIRLETQATLRTRYIDRLYRCKCNVKYIYKKIKINNNKKAVC